MHNWQLAQLNIAHMLAPADSAQLADFFANLDRINALADTAPGFIWRLQDDSGSSTSFRPFGDDVLVNMSIWRDLQSLHDFVYRSAHIEIMARRKQWFEHLSEAYSVLWWVAEGSIPSMGQAQQKLALLKKLGPTENAFTFKKAFAAPDQLAKQDPSLTVQYDDSCPAT